MNTKNVGQAVFRLLCIFFIATLLITSMFFIIDNGSVNLLTQPVYASAASSNEEYPVDSSHSIAANYWTHQAKLYPDAGSLFGWSVSIDGDSIAVGKQNAVGYVFVKPTSGWSSGLAHTAKLVASDGAGLASISISGDTVALGAYSTQVGGNSSQGAAYVFVKPTLGWSGTLTQSAKLVASDGSWDDWFGNSVAINGDTIVVGTPQRGPTPCKAYVFVKPATGWSATLTETAKLSSVGCGGASAYFVSMDGEVVVIGRCVFVKPVGGWTGTIAASATLTSTSGPIGSYSVAIKNDTIVVATGSSVASSSAYVFVKPSLGWSGTITESARLVPSDQVDGDWFGYSSAVSGDTIGVGAVWADIGGNVDQGAAYVFTKPVGGWSGVLTQTQKLTASDCYQKNMFGTSVAMQDKTIVVGAAQPSCNGIAYVIGEAKFLYLPAIFR